MTDSKNLPVRIVRKFPPPRIAVSVLFFINGYFAGNWAPKIPEFAHRLGLSPSELGLMILTFGIGSLVAMPLSGIIIAHAGSRTAVKPFAVCTALALLFITLANSVPLAALTVCFAGAAIGAMDVAMNANAVSVERKMKRAIMSSCHGFWSLGGLVGAASGGFLIEQFGIIGHAVLVTIVQCLLLAGVWKIVAEDRDAIGDKSHPIRVPRTLLPWLIGVIALFSMIPEGSVLDWAALYLRRELGADIAMSGFAFGAFSTTMAIMRFAGDSVRDRFGAVRTLRVSAALAVTGFAIAGTAPSPLIAIFGFAIAGIGISNMVPIAFSAAGNLPGMAPGVAISAVTFLGYSGILLAPSFIGFLAEYTGFAKIFLMMPVLFLVMFGLSHLAHHADPAPDRQGADNGKPASAPAMKS
jgi:predicted MFS family arabinose efflux permease